MDINDYVPSLLNPRQRKKNCNDLTQNSGLHRSSLSLKRTGLSKVSKPNTSNIGKVISHKDVNKENLLNEQNILQNPDTRYENNFNNTEFVYHRGARNLGLSDVDELADTIDLSAMISLDKNIPYNDNLASKDINGSFRSKSFTTDHKGIRLKNNNATVSNKAVISQSFGVLDCKNVEVISDNSKIKRTAICNKNNDTNVVCELIENSHPSNGYGRNIDLDSSIKNSSNKFVVNLEIKNKVSREDNSNHSKVLILNTNYIRKLTNVTVHTLNYNSGKRKSLDEKNFIGNKRLALDCAINNENPVGSKKQKLINSYFPKTTKALSFIGSENLNNASNVEEVMNKNSDIHKPLKTELVGRSFIKCINKGNESPTSTRVCSSKRESRYSSIQEIKTSKCETRRISSPSAKNDGSSSHSPRKNGESICFNLPAKSKSNKTATSPKSIPHHKIVAGTHFAVDAFSYGDIPNVKHYFLSHFHSDHYSGLKKSFNKLLYCSKITADLCISRLSVSPKYINVINVAEPIRVEGVEVTAVNANHCPGAVMFIFTLPNGKTLLHTGDFRASPAMESYPIFWNRDIHTIYLDTTYCNPRYDFPTQDQSLEMALYILRQKKFVLEKSGKKFSSVLIVCGTYTIGKEKFFLGMARRVGCSVWACPEKDRVLQIVEGRSFSQEQPQSCQLHVVPMRDLTHEKLRAYLDSLKGSFNEVVAFKPSGWENGKNSAVEKDMIAIHGIPYSEHSSFSELIRFVKYLEPKQVIPTVEISGGIKTVQKYFPCPIIYKDDMQCQSKVTDYFKVHKPQQVPAVT